MKFVARVEVGPGYVEDMVPEKIWRGEAGPELPRSSSPTEKGFGIESHLPDVVLKRGVLQVPHIGADP